MTNKELMKKFINKEISVKCDTREEMIEFLKLCEKKKLKWISDAKPTEFIPSNYPIIISYSLSNKKGLVFGFLFSVMHKQLVDFQDFIKNPKQEKIKLKKVLSFIKENLHIAFYHTKHSKYYTIQLGNTIIAVSKETYYELKEVLEND